MKNNKLQINYEGKDLSFSPGLLVESLQGLNIPTDEAMLLTQRTQKQFKNKKVDLDKFMAYLAGILKEELDDDIAQRFLGQTPVFVPIKVTSKKVINTFSKRKLAKSLERQLSFKDAHAVAIEVEKSLRSQGIKKISTEQLLKQISVNIEKLLGSEARLSFDDNHPDIEELQVIDKVGRSFPYSHSILARSLVAIGLQLGLAHRLARELEQKLWQLSKKEVSTALIRDMLKELLFEQAGETFARRYELMHALKEPQKPLFILIGGATGVGKSTLAAELSYRFNIQHIVSSDVIRQALRSLINPALSPLLHSSSFSAWHAERLPGEDTKVKPKRVLRAFNVQTKQVNKAISAILERYTQEGLSAVLEGVHLVPGLLDLKALKDTNIIEIVLVQSDEEKHRKNFEVRGLQTEQRRNFKKYMEHFQEIRVIQEFITAQAKQQEVTIIELNDFDEVLEQVLELTMQTIINESHQTNAMV